MTWDSLVSKSNHKLSKDIDLMSVIYEKIRQARHHCHQIVVRFKLFGMLDSRSLLVRHVSVLLFEHADAMLKLYHVPNFICSVQVSNSQCQFCS